jgi:hypothetical protein
LDKESFLKWFGQLVDDFGESMPGSSATHPADFHKTAGKRVRPLVFLHSGIFPTKQAVFKEMRSRRVITGGTVDGTLRKWWMEHFWHVRVKKWQPFAKCDICINFRTAILTTVGEFELAELRVDRDRHRDQVGLGRRRFGLRETLAIEDPDMFLHVSIDAMDNKKTNVPQSKAFTNSKSSSNIGEPLKTRLMGKNTCFVHASRFEILI